MKRNSASLLFIFLFLIIETSQACDISCSEKGCIASGNNCPKEDPNLVKEKSMILVDCKGTDCGKNIVTSLYSKFGCKSSAQSANGLIMLSSECLVKANSKDEACPSGTNARNVDDNKAVKICIKETAASPEAKEKKASK